MLISLLLTLLAAPYPESERHLLEESLEKYEMNRRVRDAAVEAGLEELDANDLMIDMKSTTSFPPTRCEVEYWKRKGFDLCGFLKGIRDFVDDLPFSKKRRLRTHAELAEGYSQLYQVTQRNVLLWMSACKDPETSEWLIRSVETLMKQPMKTDEDLEHLQTWFVALGHNGSDKALDVLFWLQSAETWQSELPIQIQIKGLSPEFIEAEILDLRYAALKGIAFSGSDRALHAFATGEGIAEDMKCICAELFGMAAHAHFGIYCISSFYSQDAADPEVEGNLQAIYAKYGMDYSEKERYKEPDKRVF
jgi:hypothetical protein